MRISRAGGCVLAFLFSLALPMGAASPQAASASPRKTFSQQKRPRTAASRLEAALWSGFEENRGQAPAGSLYTSRGGGYIALFDKKGVTIALPGRSRFHLVRMAFGGSRGNPRGKKVRLAGLHRLAGCSNYFIGNDPSKWRTSIPRYEKLDYEGLYPGVSFVFGEAREDIGPDAGPVGPKYALNYDIVLRPGADPGDIRLFFPGAKVSIDRKGDLVVSAGAGMVLMLKPRIYQRQKRGDRVIRGGFVQIGEDGAGFKIAAYDRGRTLVVDPTLAFSTFLGGSSVAQGQGITLDGNGNIYVTGYTLSPDFPVKNPAGSFSGGTAFGDAFITKLALSPSPQIVYSTFIGGGSDDAGYAIAVDSSGEAYITGFTSSTNFPTVSPFQAVLKGGRNAFVTKLSADGSQILYSTFFGGGSQDEGRGIALDGLNDIYITGFTDSPNFPLLKSVRTVPAGYDAFAAKILTGGTQLGYSVLLGGGANDKGAGMAVDTSGDAYVTGSTSSPDFPAVNAYQTALHGAQNAFLTKLDPGATILFSTFLGGGASDGAAAIALDSAGAAYITGSTTSPDFPVIMPIQSLTGSKNAFVSKFSKSGGLLYSTFLGGSAQDSGTGIAADTMGNAYIAGETASSDFPLKNPVQGLTPPENAFVMEINSVGNALVYSTLLGGGSNDSGLAIAADSSGSAYVTGVTASPDFPSVNAVRGFTGSQDAFVTKLAASPNLPPSAPSLI
nr:SBBP repeat-containing protein [Nitrospiraceae bacterium]